MRAHSPLAHGEPRAHISAHSTATSMGTHPIRRWAARRRIAVVAAAGATELAQCGACPATFAAATRCETVPAALLDTATAPSLRASASALRHTDLRVWPPPSTDAAAAQSPHPLVRMIEHSSATSTGRHTGPGRPAARRGRGTWQGGAVV